MRILGNRFLVGDAHRVGVNSIILAYVTENESEQNLTLPVIRLSRGIFLSFSQIVFFAPRLHRLRYMRITWQDNI